MKAQREDEAREQVPVILGIVGATASGKSAVAVELARRWEAEIVSVDSLQLYREIALGTGKPTEAERGGVTHHLLDQVSIEEPYDAGVFQADADRAIREIHARGRRVIVVGGTGLYLRALLHGLFDVPSEEATRLALLQRVEAGELAQMHEELRVVDPDAAAWIAPRDKVRIVRALEVYQLTGRPFSSWAEAHGHREDRYRAHLIGIDWPREELYRRIDQRVLSMLREGWVVEVEALLQEGYAPTLKPLQCIGYREICEMLAGRLAPESLLSTIQRATRQYARRQMTWFRKEQVTWYPTPDAIFSDDTLLAILRGIGWFDEA